MSVQVTTKMLRSESHISMLYFINENLRYLQGQASLGNGLVKGSLEKAGFYCIVRFCDYYFL